MLNPLPRPAGDEAPDSAAGPLLRLAAIQNALLAVDGFGGGPASDFDFDDSAALAEASEAERRCLERRSAALLAVASAGLDVVVRQRSIGSEVSPAALQRLADEIRAGIGEIERLIRD